MGREPKGNIMKIRDGQALNKAVPVLKNCRAFHNHNFHYSAALIAFYNKITLYHAELLCQFEYPLILSKENITIRLTIPPVSITK